MNDQEGRSAAQTDGACIDDLPEWECVLCGEQQRGDPPDGELCRDCDDES